MPCNLGPGGRGNRHFCPFTVSIPISKTEQVKSNIRKPEFFAGLRSEAIDHRIDPFCLFNGSEWMDFFEANCRNPIMNDIISIRISGVEFSEFVLAWLISESRKKDLTDSKRVVLLKLFLRPWVDRERPTSFPFIFLWNVNNWKKNFEGISWSTFQRLKTTKFLMQLIWSFSSKFVQGWLVF